MSLWIPPENAYSQIIVKEITVMPDDVLREIRFDFYQTTIESNTIIDKNSRICFCSVEIIDPYPSDISIKVGNQAVDNLIMDSSDILHNMVGTYGKIVDTDWGNLDLPVRVTISGSPTVGHGVCIVRHIKEPTD